tara:strand:- start:588 stop:1814 length:1227 start_codon:yes stop_codon:yes gene_type:complete
MKNFNFKIYIILIIGFISRIISIYFFGDVEIDKEWGIMLYNLEYNNILSVRDVDGVPVPNIFMPPLYPLFLYSIKIFISNPELYLNSVLVIQLVISIISIILAYLIFLRIFSYKLSLLGTLIYSLFPLNVYSVSQISSITLQLLLINIFFLFFIKLYQNNKLKNFFIFSISSALLVLLRGEFFIFIFFSLIYLFISKKKNFLQLLSITFLILLILSPYLYRNYETFGVITITKSSGYNLLKGNHPTTKVEGIGMFGGVELIVPAVKPEIDKLKLMGPIKKHDLIKDKILLDQALKFILENPLKYIKLYFQKFFSFIFIDLNSTYTNYYSPAHIIPKIILSISSLFGVLILINFKANISNYFILFYIGNIGLFSFFFILPRYSLSLLTVQLILSLFAVEKITKRFKIKL